MPLSDKALLAFNFFIKNYGKLVTVKEIANETGWLESTVRTYISKKWKVEVLEKSSNRGCYKVILDPSTTEAQFNDLQTQVDKRAR